MNVSDIEKLVTEGKMVDFCHYVSIHLEKRQARDFQRMEFFNNFDEQSELQDTLIRMYKGMKFADFKKCLVSIKDHALDVWIHDPDTDYALLAECSEFVKKTYLKNKIVKKEKNDENKRVRFAYLYRMLERNTTAQDNFNADYLVEELKRYSTNPDEKIIQALKGEIPKMTSEEFIDALKESV